MTDQASLDRLIADAQRELDAAIRWAATAMPESPLAMKVRDRERIRHAEIELDALRDPVAEDPETPAERRAALMSAMEGGYAAPEDFGLDDAPGCEGFAGENAWGPCARCGERLEDHDA